MSPRAHEPGRGKVAGPAKAGKEPPAEGPHEREAPSHADVMRLQRTIGNQAVARMLGSGQSPPAAPAPPGPQATSPSPSPSQAVAAEGPSHTFADGRTVYLKEDHESVQRKLGNRGKKDDWVYFSPTGRENFRGKIRDIRYAKGKLGITPRVASWKHKNVVKQVDTYFMRMDAAPGVDEDLTARPTDRDWGFKPSTGRDFGDEKDEKEEEEEEVENEDVEAALVAPTLKQRAKEAMAVGKGLAAAGKQVKGVASGAVSKLDYVKGDVDTALDYTKKAVGYLDKAAYAFPPLKAATKPLSTAISGVKTIRTAYLARGLIQAGDAVPLTLSQLGEAQLALEEIVTRPGASDVDTQSVAQKTAEALATIRVWLEKALYGDDEEEEEEKESKEASEE